MAQKVGQAAERWMTLPVPDVVADLASTLGAPMVAVIGRARDTRSVRAWQREEYPPKEEARLRFALQVMDILARRYHRDAIRAWFSGVNEHLDDQNPALLIASADDFTIRRNILTAARESIGE